MLLDLHPKSDAQNQLTTLHLAGVCTKRKQGWVMAGRLNLDPVVDPLQGHLREMNPSGGCGALTNFHWQKVPR
jgi:hypothetical protein